MTDRIRIFDTTLRDGEQSPGVSLNTQEKLDIAKQLQKLGVDIIEAGFPIASQGDFESVKNIAANVKGVTIAGLARASFLDIDRAWEAVKYAEQARIHTFIATSDIHLKHKLRMSREEVLEAAIAAVKHAKQYTADVEFSAEDAFRSELEFLCRVVEAAISAGATTINIPDTVGYATPTEFGEFIRDIRAKVPNVDKAVISVHCHNDLGLAVANSLAAVANGAQQIECTVNGIGERAGNASLEEVVMALYTRNPFYSKTTGIKKEEIYRTSRLVANLTGMRVQSNKAIVGKNAFAHESGIHQDGVLKERSTYEIMNPEMIGLNINNIVLGKHSGRHAIKDRLFELGYNLSDEEINKSFVKFKALADKKKEIKDEDLAAIVENEVLTVPETYKIEYLHYTSGTQVIPTATLRLGKGEEMIEEAACGDGPVDAICNARHRITGITSTLQFYNLQAVTGGKDALGEATVKIQPNGGSKKTYLGRGVSTDVIEATAKAYLNAVNKIVFAQMEGEEHIERPEAGI